MQKIKTIVLSLLILFIFLTKSADASSEFILSSNIEYAFSRTGETNVIHQINLENVFATFYAKSYTLTINNIEPENIRAYDEVDSLSHKVSQLDGNYEIEVYFDDEIVGKGKTRTFFIEYGMNDIATKTGDVWEINIPKFSKDESYKDYLVTLKVPQTFGPKAYLSAEPTNQTSAGEYEIYEFDLSDIGDYSISAGFGNFQMYSFKLIYHLENPLSTKAEVSIAIPPDTSFQKVYYDQLEPKPNKIITDDDGNWIAKYILQSRQRIDVVAKGYTQIYRINSSNIVFDEEYLTKNLASSKYWESNDARILKLANELKTPKNIYDYLVNNLTYNYERYDDDIDRLGSIYAYLYPDDVLCSEFTDLFIALSRAAGIPAREINGYAYAESPDIQPISLVADVLHAWPEYWDQDNKVWVPIDPTWGSTTNGQDFFNNLDLRHFTFVIHGTNSEEPYPPGSYKLGPNPQKDVFVKLEKPSSKKSQDIQIKTELEQNIKHLSNKISVEIINNGPTAIYDEKVNIHFDDNFFQEIPIDTLLPFTSFSFDINIPYSIFAKDIPHFVTIKYITFSSEVLINKTPFIVISLILVFLIIILFLLLILIKTKKYKPVQFINLIKNARKKIFNKQKYSE